MEKRNTINNILQKLMIILFAFALIMPTACDKNDEAEDIKPSGAPDIPPESTFVMDFSGFENADTTDLKSTQSYHNWWYAASYAAIWNTIITVGFAVPVISFREAFNHLPVYDPDLGSWVWSYNFMAQGAAHLQNCTAR